MKKFFLLILLPLHTLVFGASHEVSLPTEPLYNPNFAEFPYNRLVLAAFNNKLTIDIAKLHSYACNENGDNLPAAAIITNNNPLWESLDVQAKNDYTHFVFRPDSLAVKKLRTMRLMSADRLEKHSIQVSADIESQCRTLYKFTLLELATVCNFKPILDEYLTIVIEP